MIGTITYILARAGWRAMNGTIADERRRLAGAEPPAAYVSYDPRLLAGVGWYGYRIAFKGGDRQMIERARYMLSERYNIRDSYEYYADGVYVIGVLLRQRVPHYGIGGGVEPTPEPDALNFYMPNGGTVTLTRNGSPTVVDLEYSLDNQRTWTDWQEVGNVRTLTLTAGQKMWLRNKSETQTGFSTSTTNYYQFSFTDTVYSDGNCNSLLCKYPIIVETLSNYCFSLLFNSCSYLRTPPLIPANNLAAGCYLGMFGICRNLTSPLPQLPSQNIPDYAYQYMFSECDSIEYPPELPALTIDNGSYYGMFYSCFNLKEAPFLPATILKETCYAYMFYNCILIDTIKTNMTNISATSCLFSWLSGVAATGDFYCPAELTISEGVRGIPSGWTRHDI